MKSLGQHFLKNRSVVTKIIAALDIQAGETIIEIGPGHGELTILLAEASEKIGANVIAIEKDEKLYEKVLTLGIQNFQAVHGDALKKLPEVAATAGKPYKIAGNIPYYITGHLLRIISELEIKPDRSIIMIQKEVAERICAVPPAMNRLAASVQFWAEPKIIASVPRTDFSPPPEVDSAVIRLETRDPRPSVADSEQYYRAIRALFAQPRKTVLNNLAAVPSSLNGNKEKILELLASTKIDAKARPQNLTIEQIIKIAAAF